MLRKTVRNTGKQALKVSEMQEQPSEMFLFQEWNDCVVIK